MPNRRYIDFPAATYNPTNVFLQADPTTGALTKTNLPTIPIAPVVLYNRTSSTTYTGAAPVTLFTYTMPANTVANIGDTLKISSLFNFSSTSGTKSVTVNIGFAQLTQTWGNAQTMGLFEITVTRTGTSSHNLYYTVQKNTTITPILLAQLNNINWTQAVTISTVATPIAGTNVSALGMSVIYYPYA